MNAKTALVALLVVAAPLTVLAASWVDAAVDDGSVSPDAERSDPGKERQIPAKLTREALQEHRISYDVPADGWRAYRLNLTEELWDVDEWSQDGGHAELRLVLALDPEPGATPYVQLGVYREGQPSAATIPVAFEPGQERAETLEMQVECSSNCPEAPGGQVAFVAGAMDGAASVHLGILANQKDADGARVDAIEARPVLEQGPLPEGDAGMAGTYLRSTDGDGEPREIETGRIEVEEVHEVREGPLEAGRELSIEVDAAIEPRGTGQMLAVLVEDVGVQSWSLDARMGEHAVDRVGAQAATPAQSPGEPAMVYLSTQPDGDRASLSVEQTFTGVRGEGTSHLATWAWTSANLSELYGWPHEDIAAAGGVSLEQAEPAVCARAGLDACLSIPAPD